MNINKKSIKNTVTNDPTTLLENSTSVRPCNIEAEQNVIGLLLNNSENIDKIGDILKEEHFYIPLHAKIYQGIVKLIDRGMKPDAIVVKNYLVNEEVLKEIQVDGYEVNSRCTVKY